MGQKYYFYTLLNNFTERVFYGNGRRWRQEFEFVSWEVKSYVTADGNISRVTES